MICIGPFDRLRAGCWGLPLRGVRHASRQAFRVHVASSFFLLSNRIHAHPSATAHRASLRTQTVETVEKVPFQKLIFEKWDRNIEKRLVFCVPNNILAIFEPVVGDFCENFSNKGFFDSLVGQLSIIYM
jgi:hypothetical protein